MKAYLGIPYAKPPVDDLRWRPPQPVSWTGVWNADRKGAECIQVLRPHNINNYFGEEATSEDCLNLNLWSPASAKAGTKFPVIVFIYGGGGTIGSAGMANYDGEEVAKHGAIYVNFNYRVGTFGYLAHPSSRKSRAATPATTDIWTSHSRCTGFTTISQPSVAIHLRLSSWASPSARAPLRLRYSVRSRRGFFTAQ